MTTIFTLTDEQIEKCEPYFEEARKRHQEYGEWSIVFLCQVLHPDDKFIDDKGEFEVHGKIISCEVARSIHQILIQENKQPDEYKEKSEQAPSE